MRIGTQSLQLFQHSGLVKSYIISTSRRPPSNVRDSLGTPRGLHEVAERIGDGQPPGVVFKSRVPTGRHYSEFPDAGPNLITTRILWLRGLEPGVNAGGNVDSHARYIYIHGTNHEERIGQPFSGGCVLMRNIDVLELYDQVRSGDLVWISD
ncbi:MAG TPA: L,D-transpeptidase [Opitutaceae bacterium]|nr:L,D-transpeptidase [Opitutaceae bacterium]